MIAPSQKKFDQRKKIDNPKKYGASGIDSRM